MAQNTAPSLALGDGKLTTDFGTSADTAQGIALQADGKILAAGRRLVDGEWKYAIARYNADGTLDTTFDADGKLSPDFYALANGVAVQADGKIVVAGQIISGGSVDFGLVRFNADGSFDTSFSGDGKVTTDFGAGSYDQGNSVAVQADGKVLLAGRSGSGSTYDFALLRYNTDGSLDTTFDGDGKVTSAFFNSEGRINSEGNSVALQTDGKILVAGSALGGLSRNDFALARYNVDGSLDASFGSNGQLRLPLLSSEDRAYDVALQADGKIVVAGYAHTPGAIGNDFAVVRLNADGSLDTTFSGDGKLTTDFGGGNDEAHSVMVQADGKIVVAGVRAPGADGREFALARYNTDGSLDTGFDTDGKVTTRFGQSFSQHASGHDATLQPDGKIVVAGSTSFGNNNDFALARYNTDGGLDPTFDGVNTLAGAPTYVEGGPPVVLDSDVQVTDAELTVQGHYGGATLTLARHAGANAQDVFSATGALGALTQGGALIYSGVAVGTVATNSGGTLVLTFNSNATQARVDGVLRAIGYSNSSNTPPGSVQIDWTFSDGNTGTQGTGGALGATGGTTVTILDSDSTNTLVGTPGRDTLNGGAGNDVLDGRGDNDLLIGGGGIDTAVMRLASGAYEVVRSGSDLQIIGDGQIDTLRGVEFLQFSDVMAATSAFPVRPAEHRDFNLDTNDDLLWRNANNGDVLLWSMHGSGAFDSSLLGGVNTGWQIAEARGDYNGDGRADLLWRNTDSGAVVSWEMRAGGFNSFSIGGVNNGWTIVEASGDYNGDGKADILWRSRDSGTVVLWQMKGGAAFDSYTLGGVSTGWQIVNASGDFNGDGKADLLWRNSESGAVVTWEMLGNGTFNSYSIGGVNNGWRIVEAAGDYNNDGKSDLLWRSVENGTVVSWEMRGGASFASYTIGGANNGWRIAEATSDYDGDHKDDLLWRNDDNGGVAVWEMLGGDAIRATSIGTVSTTWNVADAAHDVNADGRADVTWRSSFDGQVVQWQMGPGGVFDGFALAVQASDWNLIV